MRPRPGRPQKENAYGAPVRGEWINTDRLGLVIKKEVARQTEAERVELLYRWAHSKLVEFEQWGFPPETITTALGLLYFDKKSRVTDDFRLPPAHELKARFKELDQDPTTQQLLDWLADNGNRFSRLIVEDEHMQDNLYTLFTARGFALKNRNPVILRAVIGLALREYVTRGYDREPLQALLSEVAT